MITFTKLNKKTGKWEIFGNVPRWTMWNRQTFWADKCIEIKPKNGKQPYKDWKKLLNKKVGGDNKLNQQKNEHQNK